MTFLNFFVPNDFSRFPPPQMSRLRHCGSGAFCTRRRLLFAVVCTAREGRNNAHESPVSNVRIYDFFFYLYINGPPITQCTHKLRAQLYASAARCVSVNTCWSVSSIDVTRVEGTEFCEHRNTPPPVCVQYCITVLSRSDSDWRRVRGVRRRF